MAVPLWLDNLINANYSRNRARFKAVKTAKGYRTTNETRLINLFCTHPSRNRALIKTAKVAEEFRVAKEKRWYQASLHSDTKTKKPRTFSKAIEYKDASTAITLINEGKLQLKKKDRILILLFLQEASLSTLEQLKPEALRSLAKDLELSPIELLVELLKNSWIKAAQLKILIDKLQITSQNIMTQCEVDKYDDAKLKMCGTITADALYACNEASPNHRTIAEILLAAGADPITSCRLLHIEANPRTKRTPKRLLTEELIPGSPIDDLITKHVHPKFKALVRRPGAQFTEAELNWLETAHVYLKPRVEISKAETRIAFQRAYGDINALNGMPSLD